MEFELPTAGIDVAKPGLLPRATLFTNPVLKQDFAVMNLTAGFSFDPSKVEVALKYFGHVKFKGTPNDLIGFEFGFIQFMAHTTTKVIYLGQQPSDGHIVVDIGQLIGTLPILDAFPTSKLPFMRPPAFTEFDGEITSSGGDHPVLSIQTRLTNTTTGASNMLFQVKDFRRVISIFSVRSPTKFVRHFAHLPWTLNYDLEFGITDGDLVVRRNSSLFKDDPVVLGPPTKRTIPGLGFPGEAPKGPPLSGEVAKAALKNAFTQGNKARTDANGYPPGAPADFVFTLQSTFVP